MITGKYTAGAIYVLRNPLDTVISVADHYALQLDEAIEMLNDRRASIAAMDIRTGDYLGSWFSHVTSWKKNRINCSSSNAL
ncbi:MAG: hypothetical protein V7723_13295 [Sneathiella sp.]|uniref:hypothetical protein n=1 Tax=Sneathiella sp. TaxID=1964365 RepID=UPI00300218C7